MQRLLPVFVLIAFVVLNFSWNSQAYGKGLQEGDPLVKLSLSDAILSIAESLGEFFFTGLQSPPPQGTETQGTEIVIPYNNGRLCYIKGSTEHCLNIDMRSYQPVFGVSDVDADGQLEILYGKMYVHYTSLDRASDVDTKIPYPITPMPADINGDSFPEFAYISYNGELILTNSRGFEKNLGAIPGMILGGMYDLDGDNLMEIVYSTEEGHIAYIDTAGEKYETQLPKKGELKKIGGFGDLDMDGTLDIVYSVKEKGMHYILIANWDGSNEREVSDPPLIGKDLGSVVDLDEDGTPEIIYIGEEGNLRYKNILSGEGGYLTGAPISATRLGFAYPPFISSEVAGERPEADFHWDPPNPRTGDTISFYDDSNDPDGQIVGWAWNFGDGDSSTVENPKHTYSSEGEYSVHLKVNDDSGNFASKTKKVSVSPSSETPEPPAPSEPPGEEEPSPGKELMAIFSNFPEIPVEGQIVVFDASGSQGEIATYEWNFGDGTFGEGVITFHTYNDAGIYTVKLKVTDLDGNSVETLADVMVSIPIFTVDFTMEPEITQPNKPVTFKAKPSFGFFVENYLWDLDGDLEWDITGPEDEVTHTYSEEGTYDVTLMAIAKDREGNTKYYSLTKPVYVGRDMRANCFGPNIPPDDLWTNLELGHGGCVKIESPHEYNYISFYHANPGVKVVYEFRDVDALGFPDKDKVLTSCETVSEENYWSSCVTDTVDASHGVFACFRTSEGAGAGEDPGMWFGVKEVEFRELREDGTYSNPNPLLFPVLKVCYKSVEREGGEGEGIGDTFYASCWDGSAYNEIYGQKTRAVADALFRLYPVRLISECKPNWNLYGFNEPTENIIIGLEYSNYNAIYFPQEAPTFADSLVSLLSDYHPMVATVVCPPQNVPETVIEAQNFICSNYGQRAYLQLNFDPDRPELLAQILHKVLLGYGSAPSPPANDPPRAEFSYWPTKPEVDTEVQFTDHSSDPDGAEDIVEWEWDFGDGATSTERNPLHTFTTAEPHNVKLTVTDRGSNSDSDIKTVNVRPRSHPSEPSQPESQPPNADFAYSPEEPTVGEEVYFTDSSTDPDGAEDIVKWQWDFGDGSTTMQRNPDHIFQNEGSYTVKLTIKDKSDKSDTASKQVDVAPQPVVNQPPTASFTYSPENPITEEKVTFDASSSSDPDGNIVEYAWEFGDNSKTTERGATTTHTYQDSGDFEVKLTVTDDGGESDLVSAYISVKEPQNLDDFAKCLTSAGAVLYGVDFCYACQTQKAMFGDSFQYINYVNCQTQKDECITAGIMAYPTWIIGGTSYQGVLSLEELSDLTGCAL